MTTNNTTSEQRLKALDAALTQIDKNFGKGAIMRLGEQGVKKVDVIPTSSLALDIALGVGGLPRGRVVEIYGPESSGKCLTADTLVPTNWGVLTVAEIFEKCGLFASCASRVTDVSTMGLQVVNEFGELESVAALTHNNSKPVFRVTTETGRSVTVTANHPIRVLNDRTEVVWVNAENVRPGMTVLATMGGDANAKDWVSTDEAALLGYLVGDGHYSPDDRFMFSQVDEQTRNEYVTLLQSVFPNATVKTHGDRINDVWTNSKALRTELHVRYGLDYVKSADKTVPVVVRWSGQDVQAAFLSALYECDGSVEGNVVTYSTASRQLATELQVMLTALGYQATVRGKKIAAYPDREYFTVALGSGSSVRFLNEIGFRSERRAARHGHMNDREGARDQYAGIPNLKNVIMDLRDVNGGDREFADIADDVFRDANSGMRVTRDRLARILAWADNHGLTDHHLTAKLRGFMNRPALYETVTAVEPAGEEPTFDLMVPGTHSFVANGLAVHNTTLSLHAVANAQKAGGTVAFIDAEHALDPEYAANLGVDIENLYVSQPDTGEQALEIADTLIRSGAVDLVVVDSVAALVPRAEIEGDMGDSHVGLQARLMSQALRKITGGLNQTGTTIIFINQLREKIGVMFGSPETTTGGKALKFYASVRLDIRRIETLKTGTEAVGNRTRVKVVKNKVAPPFRQAEFDILYGEGISYEGGLIDLGVEYGFVKKSGSWYTYNDEQLGQGKDKARLFLKDNPGLAAELDALIREKAGLPALDAGDDQGDKAGKTAVKE